MDGVPGAGRSDEADDVDATDEGGDGGGVAPEVAREGAGDAPAGGPAAGDTPDARRAPAPDVGAGWIATREPWSDAAREAAASVAERAGIGDEAPAAGGGVEDDEAKRVVPGADVADVVEVGGAATGFPPCSRPEGSSRPNLSDTLKYSTATASGMLMMSIQRRELATRRSLSNISVSSTGWDRGCPAVTESCGN